MIEAGDEATAVIVKVASSGDKKHRCDDECCTEVQRQRSDRIQAGKRSSESFTAFKMELQNWIVSLFDNIMKVMDVAASKEKRLMELYWTFGMQECHKRLCTYTFLKDLDSRRGANCQSLRSGADRSVAYAPE